jgi:hypothetical protein
MRGPYAISSTKLNAQDRVILFRAATGIDHAAASMGDQLSV